jgi:hypothetical protein
MLAAAECAEHGSHPPPDLALAWSVERWQGFAGILLEQDAGLVNRMQAALNVHSAYSQYSQAVASGAKGADWASANPRAWAIIATVEGMKRNGE